MSTCVGLLNREAPTVYSMMNDDDSEWLARMYNMSVPVDVRDETTGYTPLSDFVDQVRSGLTTTPPTPPPPN